LDPSGDAKRLPAQTRRRSTRREQAQIIIRIERLSFGSLFSFQSGLHLERGRGSSKRRRRDPREGRNDPLRNESRAGQKGK